MKCVTDEVGDSQLFEDPIWYNYNESLSKFVDAANKDISTSNISDKPKTLVKTKGLLRKNKKVNIYNISKQQMELSFSEDKTMLILGAAGTGKTVLTKLKILEHSTKNQGHRISVFVRENMVREYEEFISDNTTDSERRNIFVHSMSNSKMLEEILESELSQGSNIFIDDAQHFYQFQRMFGSAKIKISLRKTAYLFA